MGYTCSLTSANIQLSKFCYADNQFVLVASSFSFFSFKRKKKKKIENLLVCANKWIDMHIHPSPPPPTHIEMEMVIVYEGESIELICKEHEIAVEVAKWLANIVLDVNIVWNIDNTIQ